MLLAFLLFEFLIVWAVANVEQGDLNEPNWQTAYWGSNYPRLLQLRKKWDPNGVFYTQTTPGTENWAILDYGKKLCKKV